MTIIAVVSFFLAFIFFIRFWHVVEFKNHIADLMTEHWNEASKNILDAQEHFEFMEALAEATMIFLSVRPQEMIFKFWKPVDKFYTPEQMRKMTGAGY